MSEKTRSLVACILVVVSALFTVVGIWRRENKTVENKAVNICMECIGIG